MFKNFFDKVLNIINQNIKPENNHLIKYKLMVLFLVFSFLTSLGIEPKPGAKNLLDQEKTINNKTKDISVPPPPFSEDVFPCSECHADMETNKLKRELDAHEEIKLLHDEQNRWCLDCHDAQNRDKLHMADGRLVDFTESYKLCGQCHGPKLRDWKKGVHGRRTGAWNGPRKYLLCAHCHNPHSPGFKKIKPEPAPDKYKIKDKRENQ